MKTTKRIVSAILCVLMIGSVLPLTSFAAYENTHVNTGNQIEDLIAVATTQIGYTEGNSTSGQGGTTGGSGNYTKYGAWYGINPGAWCAMFVSWCANQAGIPSSIIPKHASCDLGMQWFQNNNVWQWSKAVNGNTYQPKRGDIIYFRTNTNQLTDSTHVGIVSSANSSKVYTIEGNASNKCQTKSYDTSSAYILGYGTPKYSNTSGGGSTSAGTAGLGTYKITATSLNMRSGAGTSYDVVQVLTNGAEINITEVSSNNWGYGTYNGKSGWISLNSSYSTLISTYYYITFDPNGGTVPSGQVMVYAIKSGAAYNTAISKIPEVTRNGYEFDGWYYGNYKLTHLTDTFGAGKDSTFVAKWTAKLGQYQITTNSDPLNIRDKASSADSNVIGQVPKGTVVNITTISGDWGFCTYNGVSGWVSLAYCTYYGAPVVEEPDSGVKTYTLTFDPNGGTMPSGYATTYTFEHNQYLKDVIPGFPVPTHATKEFAGWYWDKAGENSSDYLFNGGWGKQQYVFWNYPTNQDIVDATFVAKWVTHTHTYETTSTKEATCIAAGSRTLTCTGCGDTKTETIAQLSHKYTSEVKKAPTCTALGEMIYTCSLCGNDYAEDIAMTAHNYAYSNGKVTCTSCTLGYDGWFDGVYYAENGNCKKGVFKIGSDFYYAGSDYKVVKNATVLVSASSKNGLLSDCGDSYYAFDANGKLVPTGFVTGGGNTYYYDNTVRAKGLKKIDSSYYYFNNDGTMVKGEYVTISGGIPGVDPAADNRYFFGAVDGKLVYESSNVTKKLEEKNGKYYLYYDGVMQVNGLCLYDGNYYYALRDGTLATNRVLFTYHNNNLLPQGYYAFGADAKMMRDGWTNAEIFEGQPRKYYFENFVRAEGLRKINGNYYFFHENTGETVFNQTIYCGDPAIGAAYGYYHFGADGICTEITYTTPTPTAMATADGVETPMAFSAMVECNTTVSADTAATVIVASLPVVSDEDDE